LDSPGHDTISKISEDPSNFFLIDGVIGGAVFLDLSPDVPGSFDRSYINITIVRSCAPRGAIVRRCFWNEDRRWWRIERDPGGARRAVRAFCPNPTPAVVTAANLTSK